MNTDQTNFHPALIDRTREKGSCGDPEYLYQEVAPLLVNMVEDDLRFLGRPATHREVVARVLTTMPKGVAVLWAKDVLLNGPKPSWSKQRIIEEVTA